MQRHMESPSFLFSANIIGIATGINSWAFRSFLSVSPSELKVHCAGAIIAGDRNLKHLRFSLGGELAARWSTSIYDVEACLTECVSAGFALRDLNFNRRSSQY